MNISKERMKDIARYLCLFPPGVLVNNLAFSVLLMYSEPGNTLVFFLGWALLLLSSVYLLAATGLIFSCEVVKFLAHPSRKEVKE